MTFTTRRGDRTEPRPQVRRSTATLLPWVTLGLFLLRVLGQVEVWLLAPDWLPPMSAWYSGRLPYPALLPAQIALLMLMAVLAYDRTLGAGRTTTWSMGARRALRWAAGIYFLVMALRLGLALHRHGDDFYLHGAIPIAFHWVLALFLLALARPPPGQ